MRIRSGIKIKLFLTILAAVLTVVLGMHLLMQWSFSRGFLSYVHGLEMQRLEQLVPWFTDSYTRHGGWAALRQDRHAMRELLHDALLDGRRPSMRPRHARPDEEQAFRREPSSPRAVKQFERRLVLLDANRQPVHAPQPLPKGIELLPLTRDDDTIGYLGLMPRKLPEDNQQLKFLQTQRRSFSLISLLIACAATLLALPLAHHLVRRIRTLASGTRALTDGDFAVRLPVTSQDELGQLASDFNRLALTLEKNEQQRRQWVADISHELRTPLAVLRGEIEALQDGVRPTTPEALQSLHAETRRLTRLVDDLYQLALSDVGALDYRMRDIDFAALLRDIIQVFKTDAEERGLKVTLDIQGEERLPLHADPERIGQLLDNLLGNSLKYTDVPGEVVVRTSRTRDTLTFDIYDSAPGVDHQELSKLFERLYRVDTSRSRSTGGAGLGMAICRNIAEGHGGTITATPSPLGGLWVQVKLPLTRGVA